LLRPALSNILFIAGVFSFHGLFIICSVKDSMLYDCMNPVLHNTRHIMRFGILVVVNLKVTVDSKQSSKGTLYSISPLVPSSKYVNIF
jgi:hypothetical protein